MTKNVVLMRYNVRDSLCYNFVFPRPVKEGSGLVLFMDGNLEIGMTNANVSSS